MSSSTQNKGQRGDWQELQGVNIKFFIEDDADSWDNHIQSDNSWIKWFGGSCLYPYYNGFDINKSGHVIPAQCSQTLPGTDIGMGAFHYGGWYPDSEWLAEQNGFTKYANYNTYNYNLGGLYCRFNEGEGAFIQNSKNNSSLYRRTSQAFVGPDAPFFRNQANQSQFGNGIHDLYGSGVAWSSDHVKRYIRNTSMGIQQDTSDFTKTYDSAAQNGFMVLMSPNNYQKDNYDSYWWWASGFIQEANKSGSFQPISEDWSYPSSEGGAIEDTYKRPSGFKGINFHSWIDVPSPFEIFKTPQQDSSTLFCVYNAIGSYNQSLSTNIPANDTAAYPTITQNYGGHNFVFGFVNVGGNTKLTLTVPQSRGLGLYMYTTHHDSIEPYATATFDLGTKKIFNTKLDTISNTSDDAGGLHHIQLQFLSESNTVGLWIDGDYCPADFVGPNLLKSRQWIRPFDDPTYGFHGYNGTDGDDNYAQETTIAGYSGCYKTPIWGPTEINTEWLTSSEISNGMSWDGFEYEESFVMVHDGVQQDDSVRITFYDDGHNIVPTTANYLFTDTNDNRHVEIKGTFTADQNNQFRAPDFYGPSGGWQNDDADSISFVAVRDYALHAIGRGARCNVPGLSQWRFTPNDGTWSETIADAAGGSKLDQSHIGGFGNMFFFSSVPCVNRIDPEEGTGIGWHCALDTSARFTSHFPGKLYDVSAYGVPFSFAKTTNPSDSNDDMKRIYALGLDNIPRQSEYVDFSDQFEMKGKNLLQSIGQIKQVLEGDAGQFFVQLNKVTVRNID